MDAKLVNPFIDATVNVLKTMAKVNPVPGKPHLKEGSRTWGVVTGIIGMAGQAVTGNMVVSFEEKCILTIVKNMLMEDFPSINKDVIDAVGEITNMISGGAKKDLSEHGYSFNMATPVILTGKDLEMTQLSKAPIIVIPFDTETGKFVVEANLIKTK
jgi:chemotaxis protein CheX